MLEHLLGRLLRPLVRAVARWIFESFPLQRRAICIALLILGFCLPIPMVALVWSGQGKNLHPSFENLPFVLAILGVILLIFGKFLLNEINQMGEPDERI